MKTTLQEWKSWQDYKGGRYNLAVCRLNYPGDGAMAVAVGTSRLSMEAATRNAYRNLKRSKP